MSDIGFINFTIIITGLPGGLRITGPEAEKVITSYLMQKNITFQHITKLIQLILRGDVGS